MFPLSLDLASLTLFPETVSDNDNFSINSEGILRFIKEGGSNYEIEAQSYSVEVSISDEYDRTTINVTLAIDNVNERPVIESTPLNSVSENVTVSEVVFDVNATDQDNNILTYLIVGGEDRDLFAIDTATGEIRFSTLIPNYESPSDANQDNDYELVVLVSDGAMSNNQSIVIKVFDINDAPVVSDAINTVLEDGMLTIDLTLYADDEDANDTPLNLNYVISQESSEGELTGSGASWS